jgi:hypothetical protein
VTQWAFIERLEDLLGRALRPEKREAKPPKADN